MKEKITLKIFHKNNFYHSIRFKVKRLILVFNWNFSS